MLKYDRKILFMESLISSQKQQAVAEILMREINVFNCCRWILENDFSTDAFIAVQSVHYNNNKFLSLFYDLLVVACLLAWQSASIESKAASNNYATNCSKHKCFRAIHC